MAAAKDPFRAWALVAVWLLAGLGILGIVAVNYLVTPLRYDVFALGLIVFGLVLLTATVLYVEF
jgi:hypothetical protein